jgi:hypothetical protein
MSHGAVLPLDFGRRIAHRFDEFPDFATRAISARVARIRLA